MGKSSARSTEKKKTKMHPIVLIALMVVIAAILTYIVPAGSFDRAINEATGRMGVVPGTFKYVDQSPVSIGTFLLSFQKGIISAASIIGFLLLIGGAFGVVNATGAIEALMAKFIVNFKTEKSQSLLIFGLLLFFALCAAVFGMSMESLVFAPFLIALMIALKYDALLGVAIPVMGVALGYGAAFINPFNIGIAQEIAGLPYLSGIGYRVVFFIICVTTVGLYLIRYANKIKKDPTKSLCYGIEYDLNEIKDPEKVKFTNAQKRVLVVFVLSIAFLIYGAMFKGFFMNQCATVFLVMGVLAGITYGMSSYEIAENFVNGAKNLVLAALIVAVARSIMVVLESGQIIDTIIYCFVEPLKVLSPLVSAPLMVLVQSAINLLINSGSGQAMVTMPIMAPIADLLNINRQVAVLAFQIGDGFSNMFWFTSGTVMVGLGMAKLSYVDWLKFCSKLILILTIIGMSAVALAQFINLGPF